MPWLPLHRAPLNAYESGSCWEKYSNWRMSVLPTRALMSWLFSSPGSVFTTAICFNLLGCSFTTLNLV